MLHDKTFERMAVEFVAFDDMMQMSEPKKERRYENATQETEARDQER